MYTTVYMCVRIYVCSHAHAYVCVCVCVSVCVHTYVCIYTLCVHVKGIPAHTVYTHAYVICTAVIPMYICTA